MKKQWTSKTPRTNSDKLPDMGMYDTIIVLDDPNAVCPEGHAVRHLQTKELDLCLATYLVSAGRMVRAEGLGFDEDAHGWRVEGEFAIRETRCAAVAIEAPQTIHAYSTCDKCEPILVRTDGSFGGLVQEHAVVVDFDIVLRRGEPLQITRTSGSREEQKQDLLRRGLRVLGDDEQLATVHREVKAVKEAAGAKGRRTVASPRRSG